MGSKLQESFLRAAGQENPVEVAPDIKAVKDFGRGHMVANNDNGVISLHVQHRDGLTAEQSKALKDGVQKGLTQKGYTVQSEWQIPGKVYVGPKDPKSGDEGNVDMRTEEEMRARTPRSRMDTFNNKSPSDGDVERHANGQQYRKSDVTVVVIDAKDKTSEQRAQMARDISRDFTDMQAQIPAPSAPGMTSGR